jgi:hypothetical protein
MPTFVRPLQLAAVLAALVPFFGTAAEAAPPPCGNHDAMTTALATKFKEARRVMGVVNARAVMEIFMSAEGTWTVLVTDTSGTACVIATGQDWQEVPIEAAGVAS